jgi:hypothetical protein
MDPHPDPAFFVIDLRIREAQKLVDPVDPDPDLEHSWEDGFCSSWADFFIK